MNQKQIRKKLIELADIQYQQFHSKLCPNTDNILGVRVPILRSYAKEIAKNNAIEYLKDARDEYYEEIMLQGMVIGVSKMPIEEKLNYLRSFIPKIDNWAVCDVCCAGLKDVKKHLPLCWDFLQSYLKSSQEFEIRFGVVMLLDYYIIPQYIDQVLQQMETIKHQGYYVKMAIAWTLSIAYIKFPEKTMDYLKHNTLDDFTYHKALQKIIESYRVTEEEKANIRKMKRK